MNAPFTNPLFLDASNRVRTAHKMIFGLQNNHTQGANGKSFGFVSFDLLFALIPILLIVSYTLIFASFLENRANEKIERQILFDKLVSASNYVVRIGAAKAEGEGFPEKKVRPNLIITNEFGTMKNEIGKRLNVNLSIGFEEDGIIREGICIYRLVIYENEIRKLYFCGE